MYRRSHLAVAIVALSALALAGCGGGSQSSALPSGGTSQSPLLNGGTGSLARPTLYVSGQGAVFAYDLSASGDTAPVNKDTGYYYQAGGPNGVAASIAGIATNAAGDLIVAQNYKTPQGDGNSCQLTYIPARTTQSAANTTSAQCSNGDYNTTGQAVGVTFTGNGAASGAFGNDVDVLMHYVPSGAANPDSCFDDKTARYEVDRYTASSGSITPHNCIVLANDSTGTYHAIGGSTNGAFFVDYTPTSGSDVIDRYNASSTVGTTSATGTVPGTSGPIAVAANPTTNVGYRIVASTVGTTTSIYSFKVTGNAINLNSTLGTFTNTVAALAVDNNGKIYVGVNQPGGVTKIKVYSAGKTQATDPDYTLNNPVRRPNPSASPAAAITGMAIAQ